MMYVNLIPRVLGSGAIDFATDPLRSGVCKNSHMGALIHRSNSRKTVVRREASTVKQYDYIIMG